ncbi:MAG: hypothetical protein NDI62_01305 [Burkholderiales bacterium]|nr:hypothetical protein [Burkholderiales bacterium]
MQKLLTDLKEILIKNGSEVLEGSFSSSLSFDEILETPSKRYKKTEVRLRFSSGVESLGSIIGNLDEFISEPEIDLELEGRVWSFSIDDLLFHLKFLKSQKYKETCGSLIVRI